MVICLFWKYDGENNIANKKKMESLNLFLNIEHRIMDFFKLVDRNLKCWTLVFVLLNILQGIQSLGEVKAIVPQVAKVNDSVVLQCYYDLEGDPLYVVKWYKGRMEIFRYIPREDVKMLIFPVPGVFVDLSRSSPNEIVLLNVQLESAGRYKCEVSTDAPNFYTRMGAGYMLVVDVPEGVPILDISKENNEHGTVINANCTTPPSYPSMNVTWYLNGIKVNETSRRAVSLDPLSMYSKSRRVNYMTISHMTREIDGNILQGGSIKVQCIGTLFHLYAGQNVKYIEDSKSELWSSPVVGADSAAGPNVHQYSLWYLKMIFGVRTFWHFLYYL